VNQADHRAQPSTEQADAAADLRQLRGAPQQGQTDEPRLAHALQDRLPHRGSAP
jgi:hypothetical protein